MPNLSIEPNDQVRFIVRYADEHVLVVDKPARVVTAPGKGHDRSSLLSGLFAAHGTTLQNLGKDRDFGLLHRLDKMTSGLVIVALSAKAYDALRENFEQHTIAKFYWALVDAAPKKATGVLTMPIAEYTGTTPGDGARKKLARVSSAGYPAKTAYRTLAHAAPKGKSAAAQSEVRATLLEARAYTGKLHQVRVHLAAIGCPILGDDFYAPPGVDIAAPRLALHAHRLVFKHPVTGAKVDVRSPWPTDLKSTLKRLGIATPTTSEGAE